jgi:hypothetical protein
MLYKEFMYILEELPTKPPKPKWSAPLQGSWAETVLGLLPFVILGLGGALVIGSQIHASEWVPVNSFALGVGIAILGAGLFSNMIGLVIGWRAGFPRWVMPYPGMTILSVLLFGYLGIGMSSRGILAIQADKWTGWAALGVIIVIALGVIAAIVMIAWAIVWSLRGKLDSGIQEDWSRLFFGLYPFLIVVPLIGILQFGLDIGFYLILLNQGVIILGAFLYLRLKDRDEQAVALVLGAFLSFFIIVGCLGAISEPYQKQIINAV